MKECIIVSRKEVFILLFVLVDIVLVLFQCVLSYVVLLS